MSNNFTKTPYEKKTSPFSKKVIPYSKKASVISRKTNPYARAENPIDSGIQIFSYLALAQGGLLKTNDNKFITIKS